MAARTGGRRVPEDVSVTGFDNVTPARNCHPAMPTVRIPRDAIAVSVNV
jgi:DNA-binding LacI/PurR family transcriptional regulator